MVLCISPWNFPLAIFLGQVAAAITTGNTVLAKPAEQTSLIALHTIELMKSVGLPEGVVQAVIARGSQVGNVILDYHWPGNVRELGNRIERFILLEDADELVNGMDVVNASQPASGFTLPSEKLNMEPFEKQCFSDEQHQNQGNKTQAAKFLQLGYKAFLYRLEKYQL